MVGHRRPPRHTGVFQAHENRVVIACSCGAQLGSEESMRAANEVFGRHYRMANHLAPARDERKATG